MSKGAVSQVIQRAIGDAAFRRQLQGDPKKTLAGFDLTADERSAITSGDPGRLTALGVDQRMSKAFNLSGISAASKSAVSPDLSGASASSFIDEGGSAGRATSAIDEGAGAAQAANLRRIEGELNPSTARDAEDVSGDFNAFDPGITSNTASAVRDANQSAHAINLRRIEGDLNVGAAQQPVDVSGDFNRLDPGVESNATSAARQPVDVSGDSNRLDPGIETRGGTALEPETSGGLDLSMIDEGLVSGDTTQVAGTEQAAQSADAPDKTTDAQGNTITE